MLRAPLAFLALAIAACVVATACRGSDPTACVSACGANQKSCAGVCSAGDRDCVSGCQGGYDTCVAACGAASTPFAPDPARRAAVAATGERNRAEAERRRLEERLRRSDARQEELIRQLAAAKDEATRRAIQKQLDAEMNTGARTAKPACNCTPGDPFCSCL